VPEYLQTRPNVPSARVPTGQSYSTSARVPTDEA